MPRAEKPSRKPSKAADQAPGRIRKGPPVSVRFDEPTLAWLGEVAARRGVGVSTLVRMLALQGLAAADPGRAAEPWV